MKTKLIESLGNFKSNLGKLAPKQWRTVGIVALALIVTVVGAALTVDFSKKRVVPDLTGLTLTEAETEAKKADLAQKTTSLIRTWKILNSRLVR